LKKIQKKFPAKEIEAAIDGLIFISETDSEFEYFSAGKISELTAENFRKILNVSKEESTEERKFDDFFSRLTTYRDWFGAREKRNADRYAKLKKILEANLRELKVFRIGKIRIDIFIVGVNEAGEIAGVKTSAVET
jgi:hypothetical protein